MNTSGNPAGFGGGNGFGIAHGAARGDDRGNARLGSLFDRVWEGEECVGCHHRALGTLAGALDGDAHTIHPVGLPAANADRGLAVGKDDGVRLDVLAGLPGETQRLPLFVRGLRAW